MPRSERLRLSLCTQPTRQKICLQTYYDFSTIVSTPEILILGLRATHRFNYESVISLIAWLLLAGQAFGLALLTASLPQRALGEAFGG
ncbi:hypothetical protein K504DRAFT_32953 [Pleomassaria siparia CBS 279.74]|uniref:Uncharacterized protein n=1 Tax=Pleomassaria siparia CBS 279.74 TaxID=1314801 RepID=A0A6G1KTJ4_9PLEO|nr:hypothetical protein K504DRAFT_32953 [Pleomassaria siparia CBS 279.74]